MRNAAAGLAIFETNPEKVTGEPRETEPLMRWFGEGVGKVSSRITRWRSTLLHEPFEGDLAGANLPSYPAGAGRLALLPRFIQAANLSNILKTEVAQCQFQAS